MSSNPNRIHHPRSPGPDPESGHGLLRQARVSSGQHARYQRRGGHQRRADLSLFRKQGGRHFGDGGRPQEPRFKMSLSARDRRRRLLESLEILFTAHCCENATQVKSAFVVDLYAEAGRNPALPTRSRRIANCDDGVTELIAESPEGQKSHTRNDAASGRGTNFCRQRRHVDARSARPLARLPTANAASDN